MAEVSDQDQQTIQKMNALTTRAMSHGIIFKDKEPFLSIVEKLVKRLDEYRDEPERKGRIHVE